MKHAHLRGLHWPTETVSELSGTRFWYLVHISLFDTSRSGQSRQILLDIRPDTIYLEASHKHKGKIGRIAKTLPLNLQDPVVADPIKIGRTQTFRSRIITIDRNHQRVAESGHRIQFRITQLSDHSPFIRLKGVVVTTGCRKAKVNQLEEGLQISRYGRTVDILSIHTQRQ